MIGDRPDGLEAMLSELFAPMRTSKGEVSRKGGLAVYSDADHIVFCGRYLGRSFRESALLEVRLGRGIHSAKARCLRAVRWFEAGLDVPQLIRRESFREGARFMIRAFEEFGGEYLFDQLELMAYQRGAVDVALLEEARTLEQG
jgi:hypothetical protein